MQLSSGCGQLLESIKDLATSMNESMYRDISRLRMFFERGVSSQQLSSILSSWHRLLCRLVRDCSGIERLPKISLTFMIDVVMSAPLTWH